MAYTNVTTPELPLYDSQIYPYSIVSFEYNRPENDWFNATLYYSTTPFKWDGPNVTNDGVVYKMDYVPKPEFEPYTMLEQTGDTITLYGAHTITQTYDTLEVK